MKIVEILNLQKGVKRYVVHASPGGRKINPDGPIANVAARHAKAHAYV